MPFGKRLVTDSMGGLSIFFAPGHRFAEVLREEGEDAAAAREEEEAMNNVPTWVRLAEMITKTGIVQTSDNTIRELVKDKLKIENEQKRKLEQAKDSFKSKTFKISE